MKTTQTAPAATAGGRPVRSDLDSLVGADRVLAVLRELARHPDGAGLDELTRAMGSPKSTVHRGLGALRRAGLADQNVDGRYVLGDELLRMAFAHHEARPEHLRVRPALEALAARFGETAHYAVLDGWDVVYRAEVDPPTGAVRLTSTIGGRNPAHATAVGKLLLSYRLRTRDEVAAWVRSAAPVRRTAQTRCSARDLYSELQDIRERGYATDDQENEVGVNCLALPVLLTSPSTPSGAISVSALTYRTPLHALVDAVTEIRHLFGPLGHGATETPAP